MKKIFATLLLPGIFSAAIAEHYHVEKSNKGAEGFNSVVEKLDTKTNTYSLVCSEPGYENNIYQALETSTMKEYISETGQVHEIIKIIESQETLVLAFFKRFNKQMAVRLDPDVIAVSTVENGKTIIDIYTGKDAEAHQNLLED